MSAEWDCEYCGHSNLGSSCPCGRPNESDELKLQLSNLQKLCEEQKGELVRLSKYKSVMDEYPTMDAYIDAVDRLKVSFSSQLAEQKAEFDAWKQGKKGIEEYYEVKAQLATQTERVKELEGVLKDLKRHNNHTIEEEMWRIDKVINQDSLKEK